jgi:hypothetical protein
MAKLHQTDSEKLAASLADLSRRLRTLESFNRTPFGQMTLQRTTVQSIPSTLASTTPISWDTQFEGSGFVWAIGSPTKIFSASQRLGERIEVNGNVTWGTNATGRREVYFKFYSVLNVLRGANRLWSLSGLDSTDNSVSTFQFTYEWTDPTDYFTIEVAQNSGAPLNMGFSWMSAKIVH